MYVDSLKSLITMCLNHKQFTVYVEHKVVLTVITFLKWCT